MIRHDQPTIFGDTLIVAVSSVEDGPMNFKGNDCDEIRYNRSAFLDAAGVDPLVATLVQVAYEDTTNFTRYKVVEDDHAGEGILEPLSMTVADGLVATRPEQALFLPLADCIGAVLYDPAARVLMLSHLGRHSIEQDGGSRSINYLVNEFGCEPSDILVWLSPSVGKQSYPLQSFGGKSLHEVAAQQLMASGVARSNIEVSHVDTAENQDYFSHSEFLAGDQPEDGRFAVVAMMVD